MSRRAVLCIGAEAVVKWRSGRVGREAAATELHGAWSRAMEEFVVFRQFSSGEVARCMEDIHELGVGDLTGKRPRSGSPTLIDEVRLQLLQRATYLHDKLPLTAFPVVLAGLRSVTATVGGDARDYTRLFTRAHAVIRDAPPTLTALRHALATLELLTALRAPPSAEIVAALHARALRTPGRPVYLLVQLLAASLRAGHPSVQLLEHCEHLTARDPAVQGLPLLYGGGGGDGGTAGRMPRCWISDILRHAPQIATRQPNLLRWLLAVTLSQSERMRAELDATTSFEDPAMRLPVRVVARVVARCVVIVRAHEASGGSPGGQDGSSGNDVGGIKQHPSLRSTLRFLEAAAPVLDTRCLTPGEMIRALRTYAAVGKVPRVLQAHAMRKLYGHVNTMGADDVWALLWTLRRIDVKNARLLQRLLTFAGEYVARQVPGSAAEGLETEVRYNSRGGRVVPGVLAYTTPPWEAGSAGASGADVAGTGAAKASTALKVKLIQEASHRGDAGYNGVVARLPEADVAVFSFGAAVEVLEALCRLQRRNAPLARRLMAQAHTFIAVERRSAAGGAVSGPELLLLLRLARCVQYFRDSLDRDAALCDHLAWVLAKSVPSLTGAHITRAVRLCVHPHNPGLRARNTHPAVIAHAVRSVLSLTNAERCSLIAMLLAAGDPAHDDAVAVITDALVHDDDLTAVPRAALEGVAGALRAAGKRNQVLEGFLEAKA